MFEGRFFLLLSIDEKAIRVWASYNVKARSFQNNHRMKIADVGTFEHHIAVRGGPNRGYTLEYGTPQQFSRSGLFLNRQYCHNLILCGSDFYRNHARGMSVHSEV